MRKALILLPLLLWSCALRSAELQPLAAQGLSVSVFVDPATNVRYLVFYAAPVFRQVGMEFKGVALAASEPAIFVVRADLPTSITDQPLEKK